MPFALVCVCQSELTEFLSIFFGMFSEWQEQHGETPKDQGHICHDFRRNSSSKEPFVLRIIWQACSGQLVCDERGRFLQNFRDMPSRRLTKCAEAAFIKTRPQQKTELNFFVTIVELNCIISSVILANQTKQRPIREPVCKKGESF